MKAFTVVILVIALSTALSPAALASDPLPSNLVPASAIPVSRSSSDGQVGPADNGICVPSGGQAVHLISDTNTKLGSGAGYPINEATMNFHLNSSNFSLCAVIPTPYSGFYLSVQYSTTYLVQLGLERDFGNSLRFVYTPNDHSSPPGAVVTAPSSVPAPAPGCNYHLDIQNVHPSGYYWQFTIQRYSPCTTTSWIWGTPSHPPAVASTMPGNGGTEYWSGFEDNFDTSALDDYSINAAGDAFFLYLRTTHIATPVLIYPLTEFFRSSGDAATGGFYTETIDHALDGWFFVDN